MDIIRNEKGEGYIDVCVLVLCVFLMLGLVDRKSTRLNSSHT